MRSYDVAINKLSNLVKELQKRVYKRIIFLDGNESEEEVSRMFEENPGVIIFDSEDNLED